MPFLTYVKEDQLNILVDPFIELQNTRRYRVNHFCGCPLSGEWSQISKVNTPSLLPTGLLDDPTTVCMLRDFLAAPKPPNIAPVDVLHVVLLLLRRATDHAVFDSQLRLAESFGCDQKTIVRSQQRLEQTGWLARPQRKGRTCALSLNFEAVPVGPTLELKLTPASGRLAVAYQDALRKLGRRQFPKHWLAQQRPSAQRVLDRCGGDDARARAIIQHAITHPKHRLKARASLYNLLLRWQGILQTFVPPAEQDARLSATEIEALAGMGLALVDGKLVTADGREVSAETQALALERIVHCRTKQPVA